MNDKLVSILIPVYNREKYICECIESATRQTYKNIEVIVYDNCSTDNTLKICEDLAAKDPRIKVFRNETNVGPVRNWLCCLERASGSYGKFLFSDDLIFPQYLEKLLPFLDNDDVGFVYSAAVVGQDKYSKNIKYAGLKDIEFLSSDDYIFGSIFLPDFPVSPGCAIFRIEDLKENILTSVPSPRIKNFCDHGAGIDLLIFLLTAKKYKSIVRVSTPLVFFRQHEDSITIVKCRENNNTFFKYYNQAVLWFSKENMKKKLFVQVCVFLWRREQKQAKQKYSIDTFISEYFSEIIEINSFDRIGCILIIKLRNLKNKIVKIFGK